MKTKALILCFILLLSLGAVGCKTTATEPEPTPPIEPTPSPTASVVIRSRTTGEVLNEEAVYKPVGVMIENHSAARPQYGMQDADIVYEAPVEGCTRFLCIYNDTIPENIAPVRSARLYYIRFAQEWGCAYVHYGGAESGKSNIYVDDYLKQLKSRGLEIDFYKGYSKYYWRTGNKGVHTVHVNVQTLQSLIEEEELEGRTFLFDENAGSDGEAFTKVILPFAAGGDVSYVYDPSRDLLVRSQSGKEFKDAITGEAITVQNLIVQYNHYYHGNEGQRPLAVRHHGQRQGGVFHRRQAHCGNLGENQLRFPHAVSRHQRQRNRPAPRKYMDILAPGQQGNNRRTIVFFA